MCKLWIVGGTTEARELLDNIKDKEFEIFVSVATDYGKDVLSYLENRSNIHIISKRMNSSEMIEFINYHGFKYVIDATHPHALIVSDEIKRAVSATNIIYLNLERRLSPQEDAKGIISFDTLDNAVSYLKDKKGNVFAVTGAKEIFRYSSLDNVRERLYARVLPMESSLKACMDLGIHSSHIICMQGPFSKALNIEMLKYAGAEFMVTKNSGDYGGLSEKISACQELGVKLILIRAVLSNDSLNITEVLKRLKVQ